MINLTRLLFCDLAKIREELLCKCLRNLEDLELTLVFFFVPCIHLGILCTASLTTTGFLLSFPLKLREAVLLPPTPRVEEIVINV